MDLRALTIKKFHDGLLKKEFTAFEAVSSFFDRINEKDGEIGAFLHLMERDAVSAAKDVDQSVARGDELGALAGAPLAIKDNILIEGSPATAASKILASYGAAYDATVVRKLKKERAIFLGKTNLDEFAMGSSTENSAFRVTRNPHDLKRVPGGSSGGSAAAVAAGMALASLGSDTGGSIRQPAGFCGVVGLKPTYGAVSRYGLIALASSLDQIGPIAKTVEDAEILFEAIRGHDALDATSVPAPRSPEETREFTVGVPKEYFIDGLSREVSEATEGVIEALKSEGIKFREVSLPHTPYAVSCYYIVMPAEASSNLARYDGLRYAGGEGEKEQSLSDAYRLHKTAGFGTEPKRRIILGTFVLSSGYYEAYYGRAQKVRRLILQDFENAFRTVDALITPVSPTEPFKIGEKLDDPVAMYLSDIFTIPANLAGIPAISVPVKRPGKLPIGFQLMGRHFGEADILRLGRYYERITEGASQ